MPLEISIKVCELGTIAISVIGSNELARDYGPDVIEIIAGKLDEMALLACRRQDGKRGCGDGKECGK